MFSSPQSPVSPSAQIKRRSFGGMNRDLSSFLPSFPPAKRLSALSISSPTTSSPVLTPEPLLSPSPMPHLSASRALFEEGLYSDVTVILQVPGSIKKSLHLHSRILSRESELFEALLAGTKNTGEKAIVLLDEKDANGSQVIEIQCVDPQELYAFESSLRLLYTGSWCSDRDFQTSSLDTRLRRGLDVMSQAGRLSLKGSTTALLQEEITQMCQNKPELLEKMSKSLRPEDREDDQAILKFDRDALQQMCRVAVVKAEIRDHCELAIARNLYGSKKFRDLRMSPLQTSELRPGYIFPPGGQESIYLLKGAPSLPLHPCRATNVDALRHVVDYYTAYNSREPLRTREFYVVPTEDEVEDDDDIGHRSVVTLHDVTFYRVAFSSGYQWLLDQVIKVSAPFELIILLLKDAIDENTDRSNNVAFGEFVSAADGDVYLQGVNYITNGLLHAFQDPTLESFRNPGVSGSLLNMISYGINSLTDLPPLRPRPESANKDANASHHHQEYPALPTLVMEFFWQVLELALKRPHHLEFVQLLLESITKIAPLTPFEVFDRVEERLAELLEETRKKIMEQRGDVPLHDEPEDEEADTNGSDIVSPRVVGGKSDDTFSNIKGSFSEGHRSEISSVRLDDPEERRSMVSSVLFASEPTRAATVLSSDDDDDTSSLYPDELEPEAEVEEVEAPWMRPEYLQPLCLQLLTTFPMNIQSSLLWAIHDLQLL
ncbi:hypothetical protein BX616_008108 [Lobosporangium transversale]|uniref:BTB domain-containing protein n=1 Tax=Lobosporangium transversale TaxID=64571 RepID=A0A1Y2GRD9_9FUNG|nr:hypothetical protein BCR41DRAFT_395081 [Lobosporangium transversale]KAF9918528.1 hypothetical protein BX616_008108 [Lobosporangium transversale]ORZ20067.1 hypothetical protein BCR41DRAFT_395081 [Lobosporangium transversale]|eukprot:XP_021882607.1 hypothetical protein BCR41DRAFT_395081 [Lobosporangium transversale]